MGLSQTEFGLIGEVGKTTVQAWERGAAFPNALFLEAVAQRGADVRFIVTGARDYEPPPPLSAEEQTLLDRWREASREVKNAAMGALLGADAARGARQMFAGKVGHVTQGDAHFSGGKFVVHDERRTVYGPASKTVRVKAPKKP